MTFALNVTTSAPAGVDGSLWSTFSPISKLITIASVNNKAQFEVCLNTFPLVVLCCNEVVKPLSGGVALSIRELSACYCCGRGLKSVINMDMCT